MVSPVQRPPLYFLHCDCLLEQHEHLATAQNPGCVLADAIWVSLLILATAGLNHAVLTHEPSQPPLQVAWPDVPFVLA